MAAAFKNLVLWQALDRAHAGPSNAVKMLVAGVDFDLTYCIPISFDKRRTDVTGAQSEQDAHPDTGPAGGLVEIQVTINRSEFNSDFLKTMLHWYGTLNATEEFKRGFLGLSNADNPELDLVPKEKLGYRLIHFGQINPADFPSRQTWRITLQFGGEALKLPVLQ